MTLTRSKVKVKVTGLLNFRQLAKPCMLAAMTAAPLWGFLVLGVLPMAVARSSFDRVTKSQGKGQFWGLSGPFKSIGNLCCSRRCRVRCQIDHSITNNVAQEGIIQYAMQAQIGIRKILSAGGAAHRRERG